MEKVKVGMIGLGTVGIGVFKVLEKNSEVISKKVGKPVEIVKILVKNLDKPRDIDLPKGVLTDNPDEILEDPEIKVIIEVMGGTDLAKEYILKAFSKGKHVITANKDLLALYGKELFSAAQQSYSNLFFEASVAGGIPIIRPLKECLAGNKLEQVMGIVNGTTNYILTKMTEEASDFNEVLLEAQNLGYAEADPTDDIMGYDAARKIAILASVAFSSRVTFQDVYVEGITEITSEDIEYAKELGYIIKLLGIAKANNGYIEARVHPAFIPKTHPLAAVTDVFNAIFVKGDAVGEAMFYGRGAGSMPTASAVLGDVIAAARDVVHGVGGRISCTCFDNKSVMPIGQIMTKYYIRMNVTDKPGVLANIASVFSNHDVSIASVVQKNTLDEGNAEIVLITHRVKENSIRESLRIIEGMSFVNKISSLIRVEDDN